MGDMDFQQYRIHVVKAGAMYKEHMSTKPYFGRYQSDHNLSANTTIFHALIMMCSEIFSAPQAKVRMATVLFRNTLPSI